MFSIGSIEPQSVAVSSNGEIACADLKICCVRVWTTTGSNPREAIWGAGMFAKPFGVDFMGNGNIVVTDVQKKLGRLW